MSFFCPCPAIDVDQHSFPTRRSSDLVISKSRPPFRQPTVPNRLPCSHTASAQGRTRADAVWLRSEEHTSELQSRLHLVCRFLLEKKRTIDSGTTAIMERRTGRSLSTT